MELKPISCTKLPKYAAAVMSAAVLLSGVPQSAAAEPVPADDMEEVALAGGFPFSTENENEIVQPEGETAGDWGREVELGGDIAIYSGDIDFDGDVDEKDAEMLQQVLTGQRDPRTDILYSADLNYDGCVNAVDLSLLKQQIMEERSTVTEHKFSSMDGSYNIVARVRSYQDNVSTVMITWRDPDGDEEGSPTTFTVKGGDPFAAKGSWETVMPPADTPAATDSGTYIFTDGVRYALEWDSFGGVTVRVYDSASDWQAYRILYPSRTKYKQSFTTEIGSMQEPELNALTVTGESYAPLEKKVQIHTRTNSATSTMRGRVGLPVTVSAKSAVSGLKCTLQYAPDELRWIPERNLAVVFRAENGDSFALIDFTADEAADTVSFAYQGNGTYVVVDRYTYFKDPEYAYEIPDDIMIYTSDWERSGNTNDIMPLVDKDYARACAADNSTFHVKNASELAAFVYYANVVDNRATLILENHIDLDGYQWAALEDFSGEIDGNGYTISNLTIPFRSEGGFIAQASFAYVHDISFKGALVSCKGNGGIVCGTDTSHVGTGTRFVNVHADGVIEKTGTTNFKVGSLLGYGLRAEFRDCTADVQCGGKKLAYFSGDLEKTAYLLENGTEDYRLTLDDAYVLTAEGTLPEGGLSLIVLRDGKQELERGFKENTLDLHVIESLALVPGDYQLLLTQYSRRVSNIVTYTVAE